jgi:hypothetical protein
VTGTWTFTDVEFVALWEEVTDARLPFPFTFTPRTPLFDDYRREKREVCARVRRLHGASIVALVETIASPDIRLTAHAWAPAGQGDRHPRLLAVRRQSRGLVVAQLAGERPWHSEGFVVRAVEARDLANAVVDALPHAPAGGRGDMILPRPDARRFAAASVSRVGRVDVAPGRSPYGSRPTVRRSLEWWDLADDGRYVIVPGESPTAVPAGPSTLRNMINSVIAEIVLAIGDERGY